MTASVSSNGHGSFSLTITDSTSNHYNSQTITQTLRQAQLQSAEWIVEAPYSGGVLPLADFGSVSFSGAQFTTSSGTTYAIDGYGPGTYDPITMIDSANGATATPSALKDSSGSSSFNVTYSSSSSTSTTTTSTTTTTSSSGSLGVVISCDVSSCTYSPNSFAYITVTVTSSSSPTSVVSGASVTLTISGPGGTSSGSGTTSSNGQVVFKYRISPHAAQGSYSLTAVATYGSSSGTGQGSLTVG